MKHDKDLTLIDILNLEKELELLEKKIRTKFAEPGIQTKISKVLKIDLNQLSGFKSGRRTFSVKRLLEIGKALAGK